MNAVFLGTNGWFDTETGKTLSVLIRSDEFDIVFDAGSGLHNIGRYIDGEKPVYMMLSHFHLDHIIGLHGLVRLNCRRGLTIAGPEGAKRIIEQIVNTPFTMPLDRLGYSVELLEFPAGKERIPFEIEALPMLHSDPCLGYRITVDGLTVAFCTDTGYCANAVRLAEGADLLITECSFLPGEERSEWPHLNPETAAKIALEAGAKKLVLTHFDPTRYVDLKTRRRAELAAAEIFPRVIVSVDHMDLEIFDMERAGFADW